MAATGNGEGPVGRRRLRLGMVGGGRGAYIGGIHRFAARLDGAYDVVAGAFDLDAERGHAFATDNHIDADRSYADFKAMVAGESAREDRIDVVAICTPNHTHYPIARAFLEAGFDVICEKPLTTTVEDAVAMVEAAERAKRFLGVTYTYSGYPLVHEARAMVAAGAIGRVRVVQVEYPLEWMATAIEQGGNQQAAWRTDPKKSGRGGSVGDIGTHAYHLAGFVTGLKLDSLCSDLATFVPGRALDDNAHVMLRYEGGARGLLWSSQVAIGCSNGLRLRVFGETGSLSWSQEEPNTLLHAPLDSRPVVVKRGPRRRCPREDAHAAGPSRRLYRGLRQPVPRLRRSHPGPARRARAGQVGDERAYRVRRPQGRCLRGRGGGLPWGRGAALDQARLRLTPAGRVS